ncbi:MAG: DUF262 domain-containing protein [Microscillaceae bacterium]|nr:DUF262 domain-containing protein [Microscillaceae bacterium]
MQTEISKPQDIEIIEKDEQTAEIDKGDYESTYPYDPLEKDIDIREDKQSIFQFMRQYDNGKLIIDPDYQRNLVWTPFQMSRFIESVILNFPLPPFYVNQRKDGKYVIIDGLQRTTTLHKFIKSEFKLSGLKSLTDLNNKTFDELPEGYPSLIEDKNLLLYIIKPSTPIKVIYELFDRINTGGTPLNRQEVRNCIYSGEATKLLNALSENVYFKKATHNSLSSKRMKDKEVILRYLAFKIFDYQTEYNGNFSEFLDKAMIGLNKLNPEKLEILKKDFERSMKLTYEFFGELNFRLSSDSENKQFLNISILDSVSYFFSTQSDEFLLKNKNNIIENFSKLLKDDTYLESVRLATSTRTRVINRFSKAQEILGKV